MSLANETFSAAKAFYKVRRVDTDYGAALELAVGRAHKPIAPGLSDSDQLATRTGRATRLRRKQSELLHTMFVTLGARVGRAGTLVWRPVW